jgi:CheY-like chemotaxis protein
MAAVTPPKYYGQVMDIENSLLGSARVLLVDRDKAVRSAMERYFRRITRLFVTVKSAEEALPLLDGPFWDIIVCDLVLPGMNGIDFCKRVKNLNPDIVVQKSFFYWPNSCFQTAKFTTLNRLNA